MRSAVGPGPLAALIRPGPGAGIAEALVDLPAFVEAPMAVLVEKGVELHLVFVERQRARLAHDVIERVADLRIVRRQLFRGLLFRAGWRRQAAGAGEEDDAGEDDDRRSGLHETLLGDQEGQVMCGVADSQLDVAGMVAFLHKVRRPNPLNCPRSRQTCRIYAIGSSSGQLVMEDAGASSRARAQPGRLRRNPLFTV